jgi:predicted DNA-binding transcriptional regulator AlpA
VNTESRGTEIKAYSIDQFCASHNISRALLYKLLKAGNGPRVMKIGTRTTISAEAAAEWRHQMEINSSSTAA